MFDSRGRATLATAAFGTAIEAKTATLYDAAGNVIEVQSPRYFDSNDTEGFQKARETWTYSGRNLVLFHTEAPGAALAASESFTYDLDGREKSHTDFGGHVWVSAIDSCCGHSVASIDPLGHGSISNSDPAGRDIHICTVADVNSHLANYFDPIDAKTLAERTTRYDVLGRSIASTAWLVPRGNINSVNPPIAGLDGVSSSEGLTTRNHYDSNLSDGVGLENPGGISLVKVGTGATGSFSISLANAIAKLASPVAQSGAGIAFDANSPGSALVSVNAEDEIKFSIRDATGRVVMSGMLNNYRGSGTSAANTLASWGCSAPDATSTLSGFGEVVVTTQVDSLGNITSTWSDGARRALRSIDALGKITAYTYDANSKPLSVRDPNNVGQDVVYDVLGRAVLTSDSLGHTKNISYDRTGNRIATIDEKGSVTSYLFDVRDQQKSQTDRLSGTTQFSYLPTGQLASLTDAEGQITAYTYDARGAKISEQYPDHAGGSPGDGFYGIVNFVSDASVRVLRKQDQKGDTCTFRYDLAGRLEGRDYRTLANSPAGPVTDSDQFTYDKVGRVLTAISARYANTVSYGYDPVGRQSTESLTAFGQTYTTTTEYNLRNELVKYVYPDGTIVERSYSARGELQQLKQNGVVMDTRTYDDGGRMASSTYGNGVAETRTYLADNSLSSISFGGTGSSIGNLSYTWDANKNKTGEVISGVMSPYSFTQATTTYDADDRLTGFARTAQSGPAALAQSWNLSLVGDWNSVTTNGNTQPRTHGPTHELQTAGGAAVAHDTKGNMTILPPSVRSTGTALGLSWDFDNRMATADSGIDGSVDVSYHYDALGRRIARTTSTGTTVYVQSGQQTVCDYAAGAAPANSTYRYTYANYIDEPVTRTNTLTGETIWFHRNQQYSVIACTNASGAVLERYAYAPYGGITITDAAGLTRPNSSIDARYTYTGREWDPDLKLYHYRARIYDPLVGRFLGRDPIKYRGGLNLYGFLSSGSLTSTDPMGLLTCDPDSGCREKSEKGNCGGELSHAFARFLRRVTGPLRNLPQDQVGYIDGFFWMANEGTNIDFWVRDSGQPRCCATKACKGSTKLCGFCVRNTVSNNMLFGFVAGARGIFRPTAVLGATVNNLLKNQGIEDCEQANAYRIGYLLWKEYEENEIRPPDRVDMCAIIKWANEWPYGDLMDCIKEPFKDCSDCGKKVTAKRPLIGTGEVYMPAEE